MDPLRTYDYLTLARRRLFESIRPLDAGQYARVFPIGPGTLGATLTHIMISEWYYVQRITGRDVPPYAQWTIRQEDPPPLATLEAAWSDQATATRAALANVSDWTAPIAYRVIDDDGRTILVTTTASDLAAQLAFHEVHHRAQALNMLRHVGVAVEDLDFNALMFDRREA